MNTSRTTTVLLSAVLASLGSLTGCQAGPAIPTEPVCLGFVVGARANSAPVAGTTISELLPERPAVGSVIAVTGVSGSANGDPLYSETVPKAGNSVDQDEAQTNVRNGAVQAVSRAAASSPQADLLGAIEATAAMLRPSGQACTLHVYDSGLQTAGLIEFQQGLLDASVKEVLKRIPQASTLAEMTVVFHTLGATVAPQAAPDSTSLADLTAIWAGIVERRGGRVTEPDTTGSSGSTPKAGQAELPAVDVVTMPKHTIDFGDITRTCDRGSTTWTIPSDLLFGQGESTLSASARRALAEPVDILTAHPTARVTVVGHTSSEGSTAGNQELSNRRAAAVMSYLQESVGTRVRIRAVGKGESEPTVDETGKSGTALEAARQANRRVTLRIEGIDQCS